MFYQRSIWWSYMSFFQRTSLAKAGPIFQKSTHNIRLSGYVHLRPPTHRWAVSSLLYATPPPQEKWAEGSQGGGGGSGRADWGGGGRQEGRLGGGPGGAIWRGGGGHRLPLPPLALPLG